MPTAHLPCRHNQLCNRHSANWNSRRRTPRRHPCSGAAAAAAHIAAAIAAAAFAVAAAASGQLLDCHQTRPGPAPRGELQPGVLGFRVSGPDLCIHWQGTPCQRSRARDKVLRGCSLCWAGWSHSCRCLERSPDMSGTLASKPEAVRLETSSLGPRWMCRSHLQLSRTAAMAQQASQ